MIDPLALKAWPLQDIVYHYTVDDAMCHALSLLAWAVTRQMRDN